MPVQWMVVGYDNCYWFTSKIGYRTNISWEIRKRTSDNAVAGLTSMHFMKPGFSSVSGLTIDISTIDFDNKVSSETADASPPVYRSLLPHPSSRFSQWPCCSPCFVWWVVLLICCHCSSECCTHCRRSIPDWVIQPIAVEWVSSQSIQRSIHHVISLSKNSTWTCIILSH